jgi:hypothetical protein
LHFQDFEDNPSREPVDTDGHGTHLVSLIMRIAPEADIYVARVAESSARLESCRAKVAKVRIYLGHCDNMNADYRFKAIAWARSDEVCANIISMSFSFLSDQDDLVMSAVHDCLSKRRMLFFASAGNDGANGNPHMMIPARHESVIAIRATDGDGKFWHPNPPKNITESLRFGTLGVDVLSSALGDEQAVKTGTSVAAAVAAGMAAMMLSYVENKSGEAEYETVCCKLQKKDGMLGLLYSMSRDMDAGQHFLNPWALENVPDALRWSKFFVHAQDLR